MLVDTLWNHLQEHALQTLQHEPAMHDLLRRSVLDQPSLADCLARVLSSRLADAWLSSSWIEGLARDCLSSPVVLNAVAQDIESTWSRNIACKTLIGPALLLKSTAALMAYRVAHLLWEEGKRETAGALQAQAADRFGLDLHPASSIAGGVFLDHGQGIVVGETSVIEPGVAMWQGVCLGSSFKEDGGDRHPKIRRDAIISAGATILGNIEIGTGALIAAGSVVLQSVPARTTVAGVPARIVSHTVHSQLIRPDSSRRLTHDQ